MEDGRRTKTGWGTRYDPSPRVTPRRPVGTLWGRVGDALGTLWGRFGDAVGTLRGRCGDVVGTLWGRFGDAVGTLWGRCGDVVGTLWGRSRDVLYIVLEHFCLGWGGDDKLLSNRAPCLYAGVCPTTCLSCK